MLFENNIIINGDDCFVVGTPVDNIHFRNNYCNGGHGLSITASSINEDIQNVLCVVRLSVVSNPLMQFSKVRIYHRGKLFALFETFEFGI